jgi:poly-beta-hydroxyalkanoate depolymerase
VPGRHGGAGRRVYPGFVQLLAFMAMNLERHVKAHRDLYIHLANGEAEKARLGARLRFATGGRHGRRRV